MNIAHFAFLRFFIMPCFVDFAANLILFPCIVNICCFSSCLDEDALVFDAVLALGSTLKAAEILGIPQSSISRRYRAHASGIHVDVGRTADGYQVTKGQFIIERFRRFAAAFRAFNQLNRFAVHPALLPIFSPKSTELPGCLLRLPQSSWQQWLTLAILDSVLDCQIISDPVVAGSAQVSPAMVVEIVHPPALSVPGKSMARRVYLGDLALINGLPQAVESFGWEVVAFKHPDHALAFLRPKRCSRSLPFDSLATDSQFNMISTKWSPVRHDNLPISLPQKRINTATMQSAFPSIPPTWQLDPNVEVLVGLAWTHSAVLQGEEPIVLRRLSEFEFAIQSYIDSKICSICSSYAVDCPNAR